MLENEKILNDEFVDTNSAVAESVTDSDDFYDDDEVISSNPTFDSLNSDEMIDNSDDVIPVNNFSFTPDEEIEEKPSTKLDFNNIEDGTPVETDVNELTPNILNVESVFNDLPEETEEENQELSEENISNDIEQENNIEETEEPQLSTLSSEDMDKMIEEDDDSTNTKYGTSDFDVLFDSLYNDVNGANNFISDLIEQKKTANLNDASLKEAQEKLEKDKEEFEKYMQLQKDAIEDEKKQCEEFIKNQKLRIVNEEEQFNRNMKAAEDERKLKEQELKNEQQKFDTEKQQFEDYKKVEEQKLESERQKLADENKQFEKEKEIELEKIENERKDLQTKKDQFAKEKELEEKKLELESKNLSQSCAKFKELVSQFNSGFQQLPEDK